MCKSTCCCQHPEKLQKAPEDCSPEQIRECHGSVQDHPCLKEKHPAQKDKGGQA